MRETIVEFLQECESVYNKNIDNEQAKASIAFQVSQVSLSMGLSGNSKLLKEVMHEYKDKLAVVKYLGTVV